MRTKAIQPTEFAKYVKYHVHSDVPSYILPQLDLVKIAQEDQAERSKGLLPRFGKKAKVNLNPQNSGEWFDIENGKIWKLSIESINAISLNLMFSDFYLPLGAEINIYNDDQNVVYGPITYKHNTKSNRFNTDVLPIDNLTIEMFIPGESQFEETKIAIRNVVQGFKSISKGYGDSESCEIDINCSEGDPYQDESNAVGMIIHNGDRHCTGALINNDCQDYTPLFLTALHCANLGGGTDLDEDEIDDVEDWVIRFQYKSPSCDGIDNTNILSFNGTTYHSGYYESDFLLVELDVMPDGSDNISMLGWDRTTSAPTSSAIIHHPEGDVMKISIDDDAAVENAYNGGPKDHWRAALDDGIVEHSSSGAPFLNEDNRVVGQAHGVFGSIGCSNTGTYSGKLDVSWYGGGTSATRLSDWLSEDTSVTQTNTVFIPWIPRDPIIVCSSVSNTVYDLSHAPSSSTHDVSWSVSSELTLVSSTQSSITVKRNGSSSGIGTITATISNDDTTDCPDSLVTSQDVQVGPFTTSQVTVTGQLGVCASSQYTYTADVPFGHQSGYTYTWTYPSGWSVVTQSQNWITLSTPSSPNGGTVRVQVNNTCATTSYTGITVYPLGCATSSVPPTLEALAKKAVEEKFVGQEIKLLSNPVHGDATLDVNSKADEAEIAIYNISGSLIQTSQIVDINQKKRIVLNTSNFEPGLYIVTLNTILGTISKRMLKF